MKAKVVDLDSSGTLVLQGEDGSRHTLPKNDPRVVEAMHPRKIEDADGATAPVVLVLPLYIEI